MEGDEPEATVTTEQPREKWESLSDLTQFIINLDPDSLEDACSGVNPRMF